MISSSTKTKGHIFNGLKIDNHTPSLFQELVVRSSSPCYRQGDNSCREMYGLTGGGDLTQYCPLSQVMIMQASLESRIFAYAKRKVQVC